MTSGLGKVLEAGVDGEAEHAVLAADLARTMADEGDVDLRDPLQHLVGAHPVEGGEAREERDDDLHSFAHAGFLSSPTTEASPVGVGGDVQSPLESPAQRLRRPEATADGDDVEGVVGRLQLAAGRLQADAFDEAPGGLAHFGGEDAGEVADAHGGGRRQGRKPMIATGGRLHHRLYGPDGGAFGPRHPDG